MTWRTLLPLPKLPRGIFNRLGESPHNSSLTSNMIWNSSIPQDVIPTLSPRARFFFLISSQFLGPKWHFLDYGVKDTFHGSIGNLQCFICKMFALSSAHFSNQTLIFSSLLDKTQILTPYHNMHINRYMHCKYFQFIFLFFSEVSVWLQVRFPNFVLYGFWP